MTDLRRLREAANAAPLIKLRSSTLVALLDEKDHWHQQFIVNRDLAAAAERRVAALEEGLRALLPLVPKNGPAWQVVDKARALLAAAPSEPNTQPAPGYRFTESSDRVMVKAAPAALPAEVDLPALQSVAAMTRQSSPEPRTAVRIKVYGGSLSLLPPGTVWRIEQITDHFAPSGLIGEVIPEWTIIDLSPIEAEAAAPLDVERLREVFDRLGVTSYLPEALPASRLDPVFAITTEYNDLAAEYARLLRERQR